MNQNILKYLQHVRDLEAIKFTLDQMMIQLTNRANQLGFTHQIASPSRPISLFTWSIFFKWGIGLGIVTSLITAIIIYDGSWDSFNAIIAIISVILNTFLACFIFVPIGFGLSLIIAIICKIIDTKKINLNYLAEQEEAESKRQLDQQRVNQELAIKQGITNQIYQLQYKKNQIEETLRSYYNLNIVHPKYQKLIPITSFCEYFETGRCSKLEGHEGAYNIYENEARLDKIATQIEVVIQYLDRIEQNQYDLYRIISDTNNRITQMMAQNERMIKSIGQIKQNTELAAYNSYIDAVNTSAISDMMVMRELFKYR